MSKTIVIKLGTSTLTEGTARLSRPKLLDIIRQVAALVKEGIRVVVVTSGAMAAGREVLDNPSLPNYLPAKQMLCSVGQSYLMQVYSMLFGHYDTHIGQVLLTHADLSHRTRYLNARDTLNTLMDYGIVPIVNENDTLAVEEIKVGDNDNLSAHIAALLDADLLILVTDQQGLYDRDPRLDPEAKLISRVDVIDDSIYSLAGGSISGLGTGGMMTKLQAAQLATRSGTRTVIVSGKEPNVLLRLMAGEILGTTFEPLVTQLESRKRWLLAERPRGTIQIDAGAVKVLKNRGASLLPVGIRAVKRKFERGAVVLVVDEEERPFAHGLTNYSSAELEKIKGHQSPEIAEILGYTYGEEAIHRGNLVLVSTKEKTP